MNKIIAYRTHICIFDYNLGDKPVIENTFSIYDMTYHKRFPKGMLYDKANKILYLPRGIDLDFLARVFNVEPVIVGKNDRYAPSSEKSIDISIS